MAKINLREFKKNNNHEDSGFGSSYRGSSDGVLNERGEFNVNRVGTPQISVFHELLEMRWGRMLLLIFVFYTVINLFFAVAYYLIGREGLSGIRDGNTLEVFSQFFFFSVQTFTTVGYGGLHPVGLASSSLAGFEALSGLLTFAIITGLVYSKFSKPNFKLIFSKNLLIAPYKDITGAMFRVANPHRQKLMDVEATMIFSYFPEGSNARIFITLELEIKKISMFPLSWTINHPITEESPMYGLKKGDLIRLKSEMILLISSYDEESGRTIKNIHSYPSAQIECNVKFSPMTEVIEGRTNLYLEKISDYETVH